MVAPRLQTLPQCAAAGRLVSRGGDEIAAVSFARRPARGARQLLLELGANEP
jgi:hypothetical protein